MALEGFLATNGVAFTRRLRHLSFQPPFEPISDPQIPPTRLNLRHALQRDAAIHTEDLAGNVVVRL